MSEKRFVICLTSFALIVFMAVVWLTPLSDIEASAPMESRADEVQKNQEIPQNPQKPNTDSDDPGFIGWGTGIVLYLLTQ